MIINVTDAQKNLIEQQGYMVVQFKKWAKETIEKLIEWGCKVLETWKLVFHYLEQMAYRVANKIIEQISKFATEVPKILKFSEEENDWFIEPTVKYPFIRNLGRKYEVRYMQPIIYWRCRNNC